MKWPFVSRTAFDTLSLHNQELVARLDSILEKYHALRLTGAQLQQPRPAVVQPPVDPAERVMAEARVAYVDRVTQQYIALGRSQSEAREIAEQLGAALEDLSPVEFS